MKIANESQWNTEDLTALANEVVKRHNLDHVGPDYLLIFKTSRKQRSYHEKKEEKKPDEAAFGGYYHGIPAGRGNGKASVVEILSKDRLIEKNVLDRLAQAGGQDIRQDIDAAYIEDIALQIGCSLQGVWKHDRDIKKQDYSWAKKFQFRAVSKITRDPEITRGKIQEMEATKVRLKRAFDQQVADIDADINRLKKQLPEGE